MSLVNQLYRSKSTHLEGLERGKIYFLESQVPNLIKLGLDHLSKAVKVYKEAVRKDSVDIGEKTLVLTDIGGNETVEELFR